MNRIKLKKLIKEQFDDVTSDANLETEVQKLVSNGYKLYKFGEVYILRKEHSPLIVEKIKVQQNGSKLHWEYEINAAKQVNDDESLFFYGSGKSLTEAKKQASKSFKELLTNTIKSVNDLFAKDEY